MGREDGNAAVSVFQSRLRAKKEERMQQKQQAQNPSHHNADPNAKMDLRGAHGNSLLANTVHALVHGNSQRRIVVESDEAVKRRERAEARKRVIEYHGSVWDAVTSNDLDMVRNYFLVEGAQNLLRRRHPDAEQGGRTLLHCAAWLGYMDIIKIVLTAGCDVDVVDSVASKTTALIEAARAGHADVCVILLRYGGNPRHRDSYGDTPFPWAARQGHGTVLLYMALEQERLEPGSTPSLWVTKNYKNRTVIELVQSNTFIVPMLQKRLGASFTRALESAKGKRRSRFPVRAAVRKSILICTSSSSQQLADTTVQNVAPEPLEPALTSLSGVNELGLDVSSFAYRSRDNSITG